MDKKRRLTRQEIDDVLAFILPNPHLPPETAKSLLEITKSKIVRQLEKIEIYPKMISALKKEIRKQYSSSLIQAGECVGIITAQSIGERQTQANLNTFHKAGSSDKQPVVSKFSELLNATTKPKAPFYYIYFTEGNSNIQELRETIGSTIVFLSLERITVDCQVCIDKEDEPWYDAFFLLSDTQKTEEMKDCISYTINMDILYEYKITLREIAEILEKTYVDMKCIYSPDCYGRLDVFVDTRSITLPEKFSFIEESQIEEIYLEEVVTSVLEGILLCGVPGIAEMFFLEDKTTKTWFIETENLPDSQKKQKFRKKKISGNSTNRFKSVLALEHVDSTKTVSNNIWDIYFTFGIEAVRQYMIEEFTKIMEGINICHIMVLVDKMTFTGKITSVSRYSMRTEESVLGKASFEETLNHFLSSGTYGQTEKIQGVSASIICGKKAKIGTGMCDLSVDLSKLK